MNTQAIKIIDEMIIERVQSTRVLEKGHENIIHNADMRYEINFLRNIKQRISSLPSLDIDSLQRYFLVEYNVHENKYQEGKSEYVRYDDLLNLLKND